MYCHQCDVKICKLCRTEFHEDHFVQPMIKLAATDYDQIEIEKGMENVLKLLEASYKDIEEVI